MRAYRRYRYHRDRGKRFFGRHFSQNRMEGIFKGGFYRSRHGVILGVCRGIADYFDFNVVWIRIIAIVLFVFTGFWPTGVIYFVAAFLMKPEPVTPIHDDEEQDFYDDYVRSKRSATDQVKRRYENLNRRIQRLENDVTSPEFNWEKRLHSKP
jgi:phage shock protein C